MNRAQEVNVYQITVIRSLVLLLGLVVTGHAQAAAPIDEDTMVVVDRDALPEDIVNMIRLPVPASDVGRATADAARVEAAPGLGELARDAAAEVAESLRDAARDAREDQPGRAGPPIDIELPDPADRRP
jgi:hypothetical protein